jgi:ribosomal protein L11 methyltransferase
MNRPADRNQPNEGQPIRIGRRFLVVPLSSDPPPEPALIPIRLEADKVFGSGTHPTTQLCLAALERHLRPGYAVLDLGTGSGILAIGAARLGAAAVLALDTDAEAVRVARANCAANGVAAQVRVEEGSLAEFLSGQLGMNEASLVVVNILAHVILDLFAQGLTRAVTPGGLLILSGLVTAQTPEIRAALHWHGLQLLAQEQKDGWVCILARRS